MRLAVSLVALLFPAELVAAPPTLTTLFPTGARRGTTVEVTAGGTFDPWPAQGWCSGKGISVTAGKTKGTLSVAVAADAVPGLHWLRVYNADGVSAPRPFFVGVLPEVVDKEPNDDPKKAQSLAGSCVVSGKLGSAGDVDHFAVALKKGQTLVASLDANRIFASPMDAVLQVVGPEGVVVEEDHDTHGLDPQLACVVPRDGTYVVRLFAFPATPDSSIRFSGGDNYLYRLTVTTGGFADIAFPLAVTRKQPGTVAMAGWNLPDAAKRISVEAGEQDDFVKVRHPEVSGGGVVRVEPHATVAEAEPNTREKPQSVEAPVTVSGRIDAPGDSDVFRFAAKKGQKLTLQVEAAALGSPIDAVLRLTDDSGKQISEADDSGRGNPDPETTFTAPADGFYRVEVRDQHGGGGWRHVYRLRMAGPRADFALTLAADNFTATAGKTLEIPVTVDRGEGLTGAVSLRVEGLPEGVKVEAESSTEKALKVKLTVGDKPFSGPIRIVGESGAMARPARAAIAGSKEMMDAVWLTVKK